VYAEWPSIIFGTHVVFVLEVQKADLPSSVLRGERMLKTIYWICTYPL
jgi:hypothetical protein